MTKGTPLIAKGAPLMTKGAPLMAEGAPLAIKGLLFFDKIYASTRGNGRKTTFTVTFSTCNA